MWVDMRDEEGSSALENSQAQMRLQMQLKDGLWEATTKIFRKPTD